jgi:transcriptional regulator with GAF, ATPase, and Fis domain
MSDNPTPAKQPGLIENLDSLERNLDSLDSVLKAMFDMYADKGIQPTFHVTQALEKMRDRFAKSQGAAIETRRQLDQLNELVRTSALITSSLELDNVLEEVLDTVNKLTGAERAYLMLVDEQNGLQIKAARNWDRQTIGEAEAHFSNSIVEAAMKDGLPIITTNAQTDERFSHKESIAINQLRSIVCVPLVMRGKSIGVLYADNRYTQDLFSDAMVPLLIAFGTQAAIAISNARLFGEVRENLAEAHAEIDRLRIAVDQTKMSTQVGEIVDSEYFQKIKKMKTEANLKIDQDQLKKAKSEKDSDS